MHIRRQLCGLFRHPLLDHLTGFQNVGARSREDIETQCGLAVEANVDVDIGKAVNDVGNITQLDLCAIVGCQQHDRLKVGTLVSLTAGLNADVAVATLDGAGRQVKRRTPNCRNHAIEGQTVSAQIKLRHFHCDFVGSRSTQIHQRHPGSACQVITKPLSKLLEFALIEVAVKVNDGHQIAVGKLGHHRPLGIRRERINGINTCLYIVGEALHRVIGNSLNHDCAHTLGRCRTDLLNTV